MHPGFWMILSRLVDFFRVPPPAPPVLDEATHDRLYSRWSLLAFLSVTVGYSFFYTTRLGLAITKKPILDTGLLTTTQLGVIGFALLVAYAIGKAVNGFLGDHIHLGRLFIAGLVLSGLTNLLFGFTHSYWLFVVLWAFNGWFQSVGATTSGVTLTSWFSSRGRWLRLGTLFSIWSISHNLGEGLTFVVTGALVSNMGWRWAFFAPGLACVSIALLLTRTLPDRPGSLGLRPPVGPHKPQQEPRLGDDKRSISELQFEAAKNPLVWIIGLASACMYVARYALSNWGVLYLQSERGYSLVEALDAVSLVSLVGILGTLSSGPVSDYVFGSRRGISSLFFGGILIASLCGLLWVPGKHPWLVRACLGGAGFGIGGQLLFLGGLSAAELCSRRAAGAALGIVGGLSNLGAAVQDYISGRLIQGAVATPDKLDFTRAKLFWIGAACVSVALTLPLVVNPKKHPDHS